jgi:hypothetical protein
MDKGEELVDYNIVTAIEVAGAVALVDDGFDEVHVLRFQDTEENVHSFVFSPEAWQVLAANMAQEVV